MLFKAEARGYGEDWSEKVTCELAAVLGIPHVHYELAYDESEGHPGVVCERMLQGKEVLVHGNTLLQALDPAYPKSKLRVSEHTIDAVHEMVRLLSIPDERWAAGLPPSMRSGADVFCGYLMLDALTANQDRHHENWAAIWDGEKLRLAPSYDHGSGLARNVSVEEQAARLKTKDPGYSVAAFASRARSRLFEAGRPGRPLGALDAFNAWAQRTAQAASAWRDRLAEVDEEAMRCILDQIPPDRMPAVTLAFTLQLLLENKRRILDVSHSDR